MSENTISNEKIVLEIQNGKNVSENILKLWEANKGLITKTCAHYAAKEDIEDLLQVAFLSLYESTAKFDLGKEYKFIGYALFGVKAYVINYLKNECNLIRIPSDKANQVYKYKRFNNDFYIVNGRRPTNDELMQYLDIDQENLYLLEQYSQGIRSLNEVCETEDSSFELVDMVPSSEDLESDCIEEAYTNFIKNELWKIVGNILDEQQMEVITERFVKESTYKEIAEKQESNCSKVRATEQKAISKLYANRRYLSSLLYSDSLSYKGGIKRFKNNNYTSCVEEKALLDFQIATN